MNWKFLFPRPVKIEAEIRTVIANDLTVSQWRNIPALVTETQKILANPSFKAMLEVLKNDAPHNYGMATAGAQPMEYAKKLGENDGYLICLNNLEAMAKPLEKNEMPEATFEQPEKE